MKIYKIYDEDFNGECWSFIQTMGEVVLEEMDVKDITEDFLNELTETDMYYLLLELKEVI